MPEQTVLERPVVDIHDITLRPDPSRTVVRPFSLDYPSAFQSGRPPRTEVIVERVLTLDDTALALELEQLTQSLDERHRDVDALLRRRFDEIADALPKGAVFSDNQRRLIGAYFSEEYSFEAAALFNPSAVPACDQSGLEDDEVRLILSLRGIGEGHVSSVTFRTGVWRPGGKVTIERPSVTAVPPRITARNGDATALSLDCGDCRDISELVLFPMVPSQQKGIEDMRLVRFVEEDGGITYHGTYTAFSGAEARPELLTTTDFRSFEMRALTGDAAGAKGMALFPRRLDGRFVMLGRQDSENLWLHTSTDVLHWDGGGIIVAPRYPWEFVQMGNCGSPIEVDEGWLVFTHGVGTVRNYCMGACLLDRDDPTKLLARTPEPILQPTPAERDGYVPNVVYGCGAMARGREVLIPYGIADNYAGFGTTTVDRLLAAMA